MSFDLPNASVSGSQSASKSNKKAAIQQKFDDEKASALSAAQNNPNLLNQINAVSMHKGAIQELEALMLQATQPTAANGTPNQNQNTNRTLGIG